MTARPTTTTSTSTAITPADPSHGYLLDAERQLARLGEIAIEAKPEALLRLHRQCTEIRRQATTMIGLIEGAIKEHIITTGSDVQIDENMRWYVAPERKVKSIDDDAVAHAVLKATDGDLGRFTTGPDGVLKSQPWKPATVRKLIGEALYEELFRTEMGTELVLKVHDKRFTK